MSHEPEHHDHNDEQSDEHRPWTPPHGPITKFVALLILTGIASTILAMLAILIFG